MFDYSNSEIVLINETLEPKLEWAKTRTAEAEQMALDATRLLACTADRLNDYQGQGFFKRCWYSLCGKNEEVQRANQKDLILMQKHAWRYINLLNERDLLLGHSLLTVKNNLLTLALNEEETRNQIIAMANKIRERFEILEDRVKHLEASLSIHDWLLTLGMRDYDVKYSSHFRLLKLLKDFLQLKGSDWNINEIRILQKAIKEVDLEWKREITISEFINELIDEIETKSFSDYQNLLFIQYGDPGGFIPESFILENIAVPSYTSLYQIASNYTGSAANIDILSEHLDISRRDAIKKVLTTFVQKQGIDLEIRLPLRDLAIDLLSCMKLSKDLFELSNKRAIDHSVKETEVVLKNEAKGEETFKTDKDQNEETYVKTLESGDAEAQFLLGESEEDKKKAFKLFSKAAEKGHAKASNNLGDMYHFGIGVKKNMSKALECYLKSAEMGEHSAQVKLGWLYFKGIGVNNDEEKAFKWFSKAAEGDPNGMYGLALLYLSGKYVQQDMKKARENLEKASAQGSLDATGLLAATYLYGSWGKSDFHKAEEVIDKCLSTQQSKEAICKHFVEHVAEILADNSLYYTPSNIPENKKKNAKETFLKAFKNESVYLYCDNNPFLGGGKYGFAIGQRTIAWHNFDSDKKYTAYPFKWEGFKSVSVKFIKIVLGTGDHIDVRQHIEIISKMIELLHKISVSPEKV